MYELTTDSWLKVGKLHPVCDDYALSGVNSKGNSAYAVVADGCSSVPFTGEGSRILARCAASEINMFSDEMEDTRGYGISVLATAMNICTQLKLDTSSLCSTLLAAKTFGNRVKIVLFGDGAVIAKYRNNNIYKVFTNEFRHRDTNESRPYYLLYESRSEFMKEWRETTIVSAKRFHVTPEGEIVDSVGINDIEWGPQWWNLELSLDEFEWIALSSDGIFSFDKKIINTTSLEREPVDLGKIIRRMTGFRRLRGPFVMQRCKRAVKELAEEQCENVDDLGIAVIAAITRSGHESNTTE